MGMVALVGVTLLGNLTAILLGVPARAIWPEVNRNAERFKDNVVQFIDWLLGCVQAFLNIPLYAVPSWLFGRWRHGKSPDWRPWLYFNHIYVGLWLLVIGLLAGAAAPFLDGTWERVILGIVLWRAAEILIWYLKLLFDKGHRVLLEVERNLLFLIIDSLALVTVLAMMLEAEGTGMRAAWPQALSAFMLNGAAEDSGAWGTAVGIVGALAGVTLIDAGLGLIIGAIGDRLRRADEQAPTSDKADEASEYTGPTRPPPPWDTPRPC
jgi:hypothetical protein